MRRIAAVLLAAAALAIASAPAAAQRRGPDRAALERRLIENERATWRYYSTKAVDSLAAVTAADFTNVYASGKVVGRDEYLAGVATVDVRDYALRDFHVAWLTDDVATVVYVGRGRAVMGGRTLDTEVGVTSTWVRRRGRWLNVFYRESLMELNGQRLLAASGG
jgi:hypothetical protein